MRSICITIGLIVLMTGALSAAQPDSLSKFEPGHPLARGQQYLAKKHYGDAADFFSSMARRFSGTNIGVEAMYWEAESHRLAGRFVRAIAAYRRLQQVYPFSPRTEQAQYQIAWCYAQSKSSLDIERTISAVDLLLLSYPETCYRDQALTLREEAQGRKSKEIKASAASPEAVFARAKEHFDRRRYLDAMEGFKDVIYNYPGTRLAAQSTFFLGECYYRTKDYQAAVDEYTRLLEDYPTSEYADDAQYMIAQAYFKQSPHYALDQRETAEKARTAVARYLENYPDGPLADEARALKKRIEEKLAHKEYDAGRLYLKMKNIKSARIYFKYVIDNYPETAWAAKSREALNMLEKRHGPQPDSGAGPEENAVPSSEK